MWLAPLTTYGYGDGDERVTFFPSNDFKCLYKWVVFSAFFYVGGNGKSIVAIGEVYELHDIGWRGGVAMGTPGTHRMFDLSLTMHVRWSRQYGNVISWGVRYCVCCVVLSGVFAIFGVRHCYDGLCIFVLCVN